MRAIQRGSRHVIRALRVAAEYDIMRRERLAGRAVSRMR